MGSKPRIKGVCPDQTCCLFDKRKEKEPDKGDQTIVKEMAPELGVKWQTIRTWLYRGGRIGSVSNETPLKPGAGETCTIKDLEVCNKKFGTIYADPPWKYDNQGTRAATDSHYSTMTPEEIASLPIARLTEDKAHLHLWTTNAFLFECPEILKAWGFEYKGVFIWAKTQMGIGNYWRVSHEFLILGVKGRLTFYDKNFKSWVELKRGKHSQKPEEIAEIIEKVSPGPYLELFARRTRKNWAVWGNEIERGLFSQT